MPTRSIKSKTRSLGLCTALSLLAFVCNPRLLAGSTLSVHIVPAFRGVPLVFDSLTNRTAASQMISVTRLDFLLSSLALQRADGTWLAAENWAAYISGRDDKSSFDLPDVPAGEYSAMRFHVGLETNLNHADPAKFSASHPLNPDVNGLHWGWSGGYVFLALEGLWEDARTMRGAPVARGYSFHLATDAQLMTVVLPLKFRVGSETHHQAQLSLDVARIFSRPYPVILSEAFSSTHSRSNDVSASALRTNIEQAFKLQNIQELSPALALATTNSKPAPKPIIARTATPYRFTFSEFFPQPSLPADNPLTEEGVELGKRLFFDPVLSVNGRQSCASCHQPQRAFSEPKPLSDGAEAQRGNRNAPALQNLAWRRSFFWDGRTPTLRQQVLEPIQNPNEMHEALSNVVTKLQTANSYPEFFARAFGTSVITADLLSRALEQYVLAQVSYDSKFDRVLRGEAQFTSEEKRGFELFHTEYDPRRGQFGADCFHCHGGLLFQSQSFANNGLDRAPLDRGRGAVTGKPADDGKFAVPSLRNVELTSPYMHDGRFKTLEEVVSHYTSGVKRSATLDANLAKHPGGGVPLDAADQRALVAFLKTLTDQRFATPQTATVATR